MNKKILVSIAILGMIGVNATGCQTSGGPPVGGGIVQQNGGGEATPYIIPGTYR